MLTKEQLLVPRFEVMMPYPDSQFDVGEVLTAYDSMVEYYAKYPSIFRPLPWHEKRSVEDMPEYVKAIYNGRIEDLIGKEVVIRTAWEMDQKPSRFTYDSSIKWGFHAHMVEISDAAEYEAFKTKQNKKI